jgi:dTDP-4-dehydrorhamnose reductase
MNGTVAPVCAARLRALGHDPVAWDRAQWPIDSEALVTEAIAASGAEAVFHIATGPLNWANWIARSCAQRSLGLMHTSSVSVYGAHQRGPLSVTNIPEPDDDYGRYKLEGERMILDACPSAAVFRIGWQLGDSPGSNNMVEYFHRNYQENGVVRVSRHWIPASSRLEDTAECLCRHYFEGFSGIYHVDGNPGLSLYDIALFAVPEFPVEALEEPVRDNLMVDTRIQIKSLAHNG